VSILAVLGGYIVESTDCDVKTSAPDLETDLEELKEISNLYLHSVLGLKENK